jgi:hypothetical protein
MFGIDAIVALAGLVVPSVIDFAKKKWLKPGSDTPEATMSSLATTKPDVLPAYVTAISDYLKAQIAFFNRDVTGTPRQWVVDLRAAIRPIGVIGAGLCLLIMALASLNGYKVDPSMVDTVAGIRLSSEAIVSSWFGDRISITK